MSRTRLLPATEPGTDWGVSHCPAVNVQATITRAAAAPDGSRLVSNVLTGLTVMLVAGSTAPSAATVTVAVIDGASGGSSYVWGPARLAIPGVAGASTGIVRNGLFLVGTPGRAMTIEFSGAAGGFTFESVEMSGTTL